MFTMIVDSGASTVILSDAAYSAITADGRVMIDGGMTQTTSGTSDSSITRVASIVVGGAEVDNAVITHDTSFDSNLDEVSGDVGQTIDGSLGGTFLHNFFVTVDYPNEKLEPPLTPTRASSSTKESASASTSPSTRRAPSASSS